jgi:diaminohydroxyphosphoribosylaminopyrimidine deaminase/5-amino-6-(5-phosphoribosylamino)uracil reductase
MEELVDNIFMRRCLELASKGEGMTYPNPMVGSVIVHEGKILGEGFHLKAGSSHAEVIAINSVSDKSKLKTSTLYVNLEPCSHFGKTPPCADFIIASSIPRVVVGTVDSSEKVSGEGLARLRTSGCEVKTGVIEDECRRLNKRFFTFHEKRRPYITLKWAQSADGYLDTLRLENQKIEPNWITGKPERVLVHKWRASEQAILVGAGTIRADNPKLNVRDWKGSDPVKLILSSSGAINGEFAINETNGMVIVFTHTTTAGNSNYTKVKLNENEQSAQQISGYLFRNGIQSMLIEGGAKVLNHFISTSFWDEARIFTGEKWFMGGLKAPLINGELYSSSIFSSSCLEVYMNDKSYHKY